MTPQEFLDSQNIEYKPLNDFFVMKCKNPYHEDNTPSMYIHSLSGKFGCFGCQIKGTFRDFYKLITNKELTFEKKPLYNISIPRKQNIRPDPEILTVGQLSDPLKNDEIRNFLKLNGILSNSFIKDYEITYSSYSESIAQHLIGTKLEQEFGWTKFESRIIIPIYKNNKKINLEGRTYLSEEEKYEGLKKVIYVRGGIADYLYNFDNIDLNKDVVVVEGVKDFWRVWNVYPNCVALFHAIPGINQIKLLEQIKGNVISFIDNDHGGWGKYNEKGELVIKGTIQAMEEKFSKDFKFCYNPLPKKDPNDTSLNQIEKLIRNATWYSVYKENEEFKKNKSTTSKYENMIPKV